MKDPCPSCGQDSPVTLRGATAYCVACDHPRPALGRQVVGRAGKAAKLSGTAAKLAGAGTLFLGTIIALFFVLLFQVALWPEGWLGWAIGIPIELLTLLVSVALFFGGRALSKSGEKTIDQTQRKAVRALAARHPGGLTTDQVADALDLALDEADALLTRIAQDPMERIEIDIMDDGTLIYIDANAAKRLRVRAPNVTTRTTADSAPANELEAEVEMSAEANQHER